MKPNRGPKYDFWWFFPKWREFGFFKPSKTIFYVNLGFLVAWESFGSAVLRNRLSIFAFLAMRPRGMAPCWPPSNTLPNPLIGQNLTLRAAHVTKTPQNQRFSNRSLTFRHCSAHKNKHIFENKFLKKPFFGQRFPKTGSTGPLFASLNLHVSRCVTPFS